MIECNVIRAIDIFFSLVILSVLIPVLMPIVFILKFTGEGEIFYLQERVGLQGKKFNIIKFATMLKNSSNIGNKNITLKNDPRVLKFGKFLRKTKINELPQLLNVVLGDMSLVGPRPLTQDHFEIYTLEARQKISQIRPGITGLGSIVFRDEETMLSNATDPKSKYQNIISPQKSNLELWYIQNKSIKLYFLLILLTAVTIFFKKNILLKFFIKKIPDLSLSLEDDKDFSL